jgi:hypothetical protein
MKIFDLHGNEKDAAWLQAEFGDVQVVPAPDGPAWRVAELREADGYAAILVRGTPGLRVARWWPDPSLPALPQDLATWKAQGVWATVKPEGHCDFGMGSGDYYFPPEAGASWYWVQGPSDCCQGWGMLGGTNHRHLDITFQWVEGEPPTNEPPVATFSHETSGLQVTFDARESHDPDGSIVAYAWDFGDESTDTGQTASHIYTGSGSYLVKLTVTDDDGATSSTSRAVTVALTNDEARQKIEQAQALLAEAMALLDEALELL